MLHDFIENARSDARELSEGAFDGKYINILTVIRTITDALYWLVSAPLVISVTILGVVHGLRLRFFPATDVDNDEKSDDFEFSDYDK